MDDEQLDKVSQWAVDNPSYFVMMQCAVAMRGLPLTKEHLAVFLASLGRTIGTRFISLLEDAIIEEGKEEPT